MATAATLARRRTWWKPAAMWLPTFVGFPLGGLAAKLIVGPVDGLAPALVGGAISGAILGAVQWIALRRTGPAALQWIVATGVGLAAGLATGAAAVGYDTDTSSLAIQGAICGAVLGAAQSVVLARRLGAVVALWPAVLCGLWALGWTITASAGVDVESRYTVFGASGAIVVTAGTSILAVVLARRDQR